ncbi:MAG: diacylglycerol kinase family protein [Cyanobacteria bacterium P01_A01_bin.17]
MSETTGSEFRRARLIINPASGDDQPNPMKLPDIVAALEAAKIRADLIFTQPDISPTEVAKQAIEEGYDLVIAGGGDGTVNQVAAGLLRAPIPLGILPIGTYNNLARSLHIPTDIAAACKVLSQGQVRSIDVGQAKDRYFFEAAGVGLDALLFPVSEEIKGGRWGRIVQAIRLTFGYRPRRLHLVFPGSVGCSGTSRRFRRGRLISKLRRSALLMVVANASYYGAGLAIAPDAIIDDGLLTIKVFRNFSKWELIRHFWAISNGQYRYSPKIETYLAAEVRCSSKAELPVHADGYSLGTLPVTLKVLKHALKVIVPRVAVVPQT